jgi:general stress protein CsbA
MRAQTALFKSIWRIVSSLNLIPFLIALLVVAVFRVHFLPAILLLLTVIAANILGYYEGAAKRNSQNA